MHRKVIKGADFNILMLETSGKWKEILISQMRIGMEFVKHNENLQSSFSLRTQMEELNCKRKCMTFFLTFSIRCKE